MQLTFWGTKQNPKLPTYEQIWNWKKNIDTASTEVIKEKIASAKRHAANVRKEEGATENEIRNLIKEELRKDVYSLYRGDYYWKWGKEKDTNEYGWIPRLDKDTTDKDKKKEYIDSGVYHADKAVQNEGQTACKTK